MANRSKYDLRTRERIKLREAAAIAAGEDPFDSSISDFGHGFHPNVDQWESKLRSDIRAGVLPAVGWCDGGNAGQPRERYDAKDYFGAHDFLPDDLQILPTDFYAWIKRLGVESPTRIIGDQSYLSDDERTDLIKQRVARVEISDDGRYDPTSCHADELPYYRAIQAAIRWCNLTTHEPDILKVAEANEWRAEAIRDAFPQWLCLYPNILKIEAAMENRELEYGRDGRSVQDHVARPRRTVRHNALRAWMQLYYPEQRPAFLFGDLQETASRGAEQATSSHLNIIGALLACIRGEFKNVKPHPSFPSQNQVIETIKADAGGAIGLSDSNLRKVFADANTAFKSRK